MNRIDIAERTQSIALEWGAQEVEINVSRSVSTEMGQREGIVEKSKQARSMGISAQLLVDGRYSSHSASDVRPEAMRTFRKRLSPLQKVSSPDPDRRLAEIEEMASADVDIDVMDEHWYQRTPQDRRSELGPLGTSLLVRKHRCPFCAPSRYGRGIQ